MLMCNLVDNASTVNKNYSPQKPSINNDFFNKKLIFNTKMKKIIKL